MKRGLIAWDQSELPPEAFEQRLQMVRCVLTERDLPAVVVHSDVWKSNQGRYFVNYMPYWNRALLVIPSEGAPVLLCGLSPRVYPWIRSVTTLQDIRPGANLAQALAQLCGECGWNRIGALDFAQFPYDLHSQICAGKVDAVDLPSDELVRRPDAWELGMYKKAARIARSTLDAALPQGVGQTDHHFVGELERKLRLAGAEDLMIRVTNGDSVPSPAKGLTLSTGFSTTVAMEYRGHWMKICRSLGGTSRLTAPMLSTGKIHAETINGSYPFEACDLQSLAPGRLFALSIESGEPCARRFFGDTCVRTKNGAELV